MKIVAEIGYLVLRIFTDIIEAGVKTIVPARMRSKSVEGQNVLITGAGRGLGRGLALSFAKLKANVFLLSRTQASNEETAALAREYGVKAYAYTCDVSKAEEVKKVAEKVREDAGDIDILVNNAGIVVGKPLLETPDSAIEATVGVNTLSSFWTCKQFLPGMIAKRRGHIVTVASAGGLSPAANMAAYHASKFGVVGFHNALVLELAAMGQTDIHTTLACPVFIDTGMFRGVKNRFSFITPLLTPEYVVNEIVTAVRTNRRDLVLPRNVSLFVALKNILPAKTCTRLDVFLGVTTSMEDFVGHKND